MTEGGGVTDTAAAAASALFGGVMYVPRRIIHYLSPRTILNAFRSDNSSLALEMWKNRQSSLEGHDPSQYPFDPYHPYQSTFNQWRIYLFNESTDEYNRRMISKTRIEQSWGLEPVQGQPIPGAPSLGLGRLFDFPSFIATLRQIFWLDSLPATPQHNLVEGPQPVVPLPPNGSDSSDEDLENIWTMERLQKVYEIWRLELSTFSLEQLIAESESCEKYYDLVLEKYARNTQNYDEVAYAFKKWDTCLTLIRELNNPSDTSFENTGKNGEEYWSQEELFRNYWEAQKSRPSGSK